MDESFRLKKSSIRPRRDSLNDISVLVGTGREAYTISLNEFLDISVIACLFSFLGVLLHALRQLEFQFGRSHDGNIWSCSRSREKDISCSG